VRIEHAYIYTYGCVCVCVCFHSCVWYMWHFCFVFTYCVV